MFALAERSANVSASRIDGKNAWTDAALVASSKKDEPKRAFFDAFLRCLGSGGAFCGRNSSKRFHGGNDPATRRTWQCGADGVNRLRNALRADALAATGGGRRVGRIYWDVLGLYLESVCG